jgi:FKBP-type peptidyl-prolyl cis-trans isomerase
MKKAGKNVLFAVAALSMLLAVSCLKNDDPYVPRTQEMELQELESALSTLETEGHDIDTSDLGIYYIVHEEGEGPLAKYGDTLRLEYVAYLLNGRIFDASAYHYEDSIWEFIFKEGDLIPGFEEGLSLMNKGATYEMIIPSEHAYGSDGNLYIEPFTPLLFGVEMHDINPDSD